MSRKTRVKNTQMTTSDTIIRCLNMNVENAKTKEQRAFAATQLVRYQTSLQKRNRPKPKAPAAFNNFLDKLESEP